MTALTRVRAIAVLLAIACLIAGCRARDNPFEALIQGSADMLHGSATDYFHKGWPERLPGYFGADPEWAEEFTIRVDETQFPAWATESYVLCVYWERTLSYVAMNLDRQRGEPARYHPEGIAWAWALLSEEDMHILELGFDFEGAEPHLFIDDWSKPGA